MQDDRRADSSELAPDRKWPRLRERARWWMFGWSRLSSRATRSRLSGDSATCATASAAAIGQRTAPSAKNSPSRWTTPGLTLSGTDSGERRQWPPAVLAPPGFDTPPLSCLSANLGDCACGLRYYGAREGTDTSARGIGVQYWRTANPSTRSTGQSSVSLADFCLVTPLAHSRSDPQERGK